MLEQDKISPRQTFWLLVGFMFGSTILLIPSALAVSARQDAWLSMGLATLTGVGIIALYTSLGLKFPNETFIQYSPKILGKFLGKTAGLVMLWFALHLGSLVVRNFGDFLTTSIMPRTPLVVINAAIVLLAVLAVRQGLEVFTRVNQLLVPFLIFLLMLLTVLAIANMEIEKILPVMENGIKPVLKGSLSALGFPYAETILFTMFIPLINRPGKCKYALLLGGLFAGLILMLIVLRTLLVLGPEVTAGSWFAVLEATRLINLFNFIQRIEATVIVNWVGFGFIKITICLYVFVVGLAQWLKLQDYKPLILPAGIIMLALSILVYDNYVQEIAFAAQIWPPYALSVALLIPLVMLIVANLRGLGQ